MAGKEHSTFQVGRLQPLRRTRHHTRPVKRCTGCRGLQVRPPPSAPCQLQCLQFAVEAAKRKPLCTGWTSSGGCPSAGLGRLSPLRSAKAAVQQASRSEAPGASSDAEPSACLPQNANPARLPGARTFARGPWQTRLPPRPPCRHEPAGSAHSGVHHGRGTNSMSY